MKCVIESKSNTPASKCERLLYGKESEDIKNFAQFRDQTVNVLTLSKTGAEVYLYSKI